MEVCRSQGLKKKKKKEVWGGWTSSSVLPLWGRWRGSNRAINTAVGILQHRSPEEKQQAEEWWPATCARTFKPDFLSSRAHGVPFAAYYLTAAPFICQESQSFPSSTWLHFLDMLKTQRRKSDARFLTPLCAGGLFRLRAALHPLITEWPFRRERKISANGSLERVSHQDQFWKHPSEAAAAPNSITLGFLCRHECLRSLLWKWAFRFTRFWHRPLSNKLNRVFIRNKIFSFPSSASV